MDCPAIPIADGEEFFEEMLAASPQRRLPLDGSIEITGRCNLRCAHCYISRDVADKDAAAQELTHQELCRLIDEIVDEGCLWLLITGGEPFVRQDTLDVFTYARKKGLLVTLFTNATLLTPRIADMLAEWGPSAVEITMYGRTQQTYEVVTRVPGSLRAFHARHRTPPRARRSVGAQGNGIHLESARDLGHEGLRRVSRSQVSVRWRHKCSCGRRPTADKLQVIPRGNTRTRCRGQPTDRRDAATLSDPLGSSCRSGPALLLRSGAGWAFTWIRTVR